MWHYIAGAAYLLGILGKKFLSKEEGWEVKLREIKQRHAMEE